MRAQVDLGVGVAALAIGAVFAPFPSLALPILLVLVGAALSWRRPDRKIGRWILRTGAALAILTAVAAYGIDSGDVSSHVRSL